MEEQEIKTEIEKIQNIKMTTEEKEQMLQSILSSPISIEKPIKSPYSFISLFQKNHLVYYGIIFFLIVSAIGGGGIAINFFQSKNTQNSQIAKINNEKTDTFSAKTNPVPTNTSAPKKDEVAMNAPSKKPATASPLSLNQTSGQNKTSATNQPNAMMFSLKAPATSSQKTYQGTGFSFAYSANAELTSGIIPNYGYYAEISEAGKTNTIHFYPNALPDNFNPESFTGTMDINGKTFYFSDVKTETGTERSYMYKQNGKTIVIQNDYLIDLNSIEIN